MIVKVDNEHQVDFAEKHFENLRQEIAEELSVKSYINSDDESKLQELKEQLGVPMFRFLTNKNSFKLTYNQCSKLKEQLDLIYIHRLVYEQTYNHFLSLLKNLLEEAVHQKVSIEFNK